MFLFVLAIGGCHSIIIVAYLFLVRLRRKQIFSRRHTTCPKRNPRQPPCSTSPSGIGLLASLTSPQNSIWPICSRTVRGQPPSWRPPRAFKRRRFIVSFALWRVSASSLRPKVGGSNSRRLLPPFGAKSTAQCAPLRS